MTRSNALIKAFSLILATIMLFGNSISAIAGTTKSKYTSYTYTHNSRFDGFTILNGIDVSEHNGKIDFKKVKADGIDFAFVRVGWTGYTKSRHSLNYDEYYKENIKNALANDIAIGVYWYSQALNEQEAVAEADMLTAVLSEYTITLPVVMDYEFADVSTGRLDSAWKNNEITKSDMTKTAFAFLDRINSNGYEACLYANRSFLSSNVDGALIGESYKIWLAEYSTKTPYTASYDYWQYSSSGTVNGISGKVDMNFWYYNKNDASDSKLLEQEYLYTGEPIEPTVALVEDDIILTEGTDYESVYSKNTNVGYGTITLKGIGDYEGRQWSYKFKIVPEKPVAFSLTSRTTDSLSFEWRAVNGAKSYFITIRNNTKNTVFTKTVSTNSATIGGLTPANEYSLTVKAGNVGADVWGAESKINTKHTLPEKVTGLKVSNQTVNSLKLSWNKMNGCDGYRIYKYVASSGKYYTVADVKGDATTSYTVRGLTPATAYSYRVSAFTEDSSTRYGTKSALLNTATKPQAVVISSVSTPKSRKITVKFSKVRSSGYQIQWSTTKDFSSNKRYILVTSSASKVQKTITTSQSGKYYYIRVRAYKSVGDKKYYGAWSTTRKVKVN